MTLYLKSLAVAGALSMASGGVAAQDVSWRVPTSVPEGSPFYVNFLERFADNVELMTDGSVEIEPFGAGILMPALQIYDGVRDGITEAGHSTPCFSVNQNPMNAIFCGFPGGMGPEAHHTWMYKGGGKEMLEQFRAEEGFKSLVVGIGSSEILAHANKPIRTGEDLKGLKYRTSGPWAAVMGEYFGAVPTVVPPGEIYTLLERKGVDAIEWATPSANLPEGFHEVAPYIITPGVHQPTFVWEVVMKLETWDTLDDATKAKLEAAAELTTHQSLIDFYDKDMKAMETFKASKAEVIELDPAFVDELNAAGVDWITKKAASEKDEGRPKMAETLDNYFAYQKRWEEQSGYLIRNRVDD